MKVVACVLSNFCNFRCTYCCNGYCHEREEADFGVLTGALLDLNKREEVYVSITGGEPTLVTYCPEFLEFLKKNKIRNHIISNGSIPKFFQNNLCNLDSVVLSYHAEYTSLGKLFDLAKYLVESGVDTTAIVVAPPEEALFLKAIGAANKLSEIVGLHLNVKPAINIPAGTQFFYSQSQRLTILSKIRLYGKYDRIAKLFASGGYESSGVKCAPRSTYMTFPDNRYSPTSCRAHGMRNLKYDKVFVECLSEISCPMAFCNTDVPDMLGQKTPHLTSVEEFFKHGK